MRTWACLQSSLMAFYGAKLLCQHQWGQQGPFHLCPPCVYKWQAHPSCWQEDCPSETEVSPVCLSSNDNSPAYSDVYLKEQWLQTSPEGEKLCNSGVFQHNPSLEKACFSSWACEFIPVVCWSSNRALIVEVADCDSLDTSWYIMVGLVSIAISCSDQSWRREAITWTTGWESVLY